MTNNKWGRGGVGVHSHRCTQQKCKLPHWSFTVNLSMTTAVKWMTHRSWGIFTLLLVRAQTKSHNFQKLALEAVIMISRLSGCLAELCWTVMIKATNHGNTMLFISMMLKIINKEIKLNFLMSFKADLLHIKYFCVAVGLEVSLQWTISFNSSCTATPPGLLGESFHPNYPAQMSSFRTICSLYT